MDQASAARALPCPPPRRVRARHTSNAAVAPFIRFQAMPLAKADRVTPYPPRTVSADVDVLCPVPEQDAIGR